MPRRATRGRVGTWICALSISGNYAPGCPTMSARMARMRMADA